MRKTFAIVCVSILMLSGCSNSKSFEEVVIYGKDPKTNVCFAMQDFNRDYIGDARYGFTAVDCTPSVMREVERASYARGVR